MTRRHMLAAMAVSAAADPAIIKRHDESVARLLRAQVTDPSDRRCGAYPDDTGLYYPGSAGGILDACCAAFLYPGSRYRNDRLMVERMRLAARYLERVQNAEGNVDLPITNFNSPPDTAFVVHGVAAAASNATRHGAPELAAMMEPFLRRAGAGMAGGGVHTPNHRWVVCAALAQIHALYPDSAYTRRIGQWLAEGIDIDADGQYTERSTGGYNAIVDHALVVMAIKLKRPQLLDPVRRNLNSMLYLLHPGYEVVTEISRRQDQYGRANMGNYWMPLQYLAVVDGNGQYATLARHFAAQRASLSALLEYPELSQPGPASAPVPEDYERVLPGLGIARVRRGPTSITILLDGNSRIVTFRRGEAVIQAVRFASAFFGKGQFVAQEHTRDGREFHLTQSLEADYMQPLGPPRAVRAGDWGATRASRPRSEVCRLEQSAAIVEIPNGVRLRLRAQGTKDVPLAVEISLREGGKLDGCVPALKLADAWILAEGQGTYRVGSDAIRFGPGLRQHSYTQVRGAEPKLPGTSVYVCGYTPFDHTITLEAL